MVQVVAGHALVVEFDGLRVVVAGFVEAEGDDPAGQVLRNGFDEGIGIEGYDQAVFGHFIREFAEGIRDVVDVLEIIQMVGVNVQDDLRPGPQRQEAVHVLAGFRNEVLALAHLYVAVELVEDAAHQHRRGIVRRFEDKAHHGRGRGLAVGTGDRDGDLVVRHDGAQRIRPGNDGDAPSSGLRQFRVFHGDRGGIHQQVRVAQIIGVVADEHLGPLLLQHLRNGALLHVRAGYAVAPGQQDLRDPGKADAADTDAMYMLIILQIHILSSPIRFCFLSFRARSPSYPPARSLPCAGSPCSSGPLSRKAPARRWPRSMRRWQRIHLPP